MTRDWEKREGCEEAVLWGHQRQSGGSGAAALASSASLPSTTLPKGFGLCSGALGSLAANDSSFPSYQREEEQIGTPVPSKMAGSLQVTAQPDSEGLEKVAFLLSKERY